MTVSQIIAEARQLLGVRWRHQGRDENGIDCVGLVIASLQRCGWEPNNSELLELPHYERQARDGSMRALVSAEASKEILDWHTLHVGDVVVFQFDNAEYPQHMGFISRVQGDLLWMIHASIEARKVVEERIEPDWKNCIVAGYRI